MIEFFDSNTNFGTVTFYDRHLLFNSKFIRYFEDVFRVRVGIDKDNDEVIVFLYDKDYALSGEIKESTLLPVSVSKSYVRVASKQLIEYLSSAFGLKIEKGQSIQFQAEYECNKKCVIIHMGGKK